MNVTAESGSPFEKGHDLVAVLVAEGEDGKRAGVLADADAATGGALARAMSAGDFGGKLKETLVLYPGDGARAKRIVLVGVGARDRVDRTSIRRAAGEVARAARRLSARKVAIAASPRVQRVGAAVAAEAMTEGAILASYEFDDWKSGDDAKKGKKAKAKRATHDGGDLAIGRLAIHASDRGDLRAVKEAVRRAEIVANATNMTRQIGNQPGNSCTPTWLANQAKAMARKVGLSCKVLSEKDMERLGMGSLLGVSQGSDEPATLTILEHKPRAARGTVVLVGKGVTFDSGGISIKPAAQMWDMKYDKMGACAVFGAMNAIARLGLPLHVVGLMPATENLPGARARKPGDVSRAMNGKTIEVQNTDAEGRLILADALCYAQRYDPDLVIDLATLTGACVIALGSVNAAIYSTDDGVRDGLVSAGRDTDDRVWPMPLDDDYAELLKSDTADVKNIGGRAGGSITAARFLQHFVGDHPWVHLDIAGTAWEKSSSRDYLGGGATGFGVRLLTRYLEARAAASNGSPKTKKKSKKKKAKQKKPK